MSFTGKIVCPSFYFSRTLLTTQNRGETGVGKWTIIVKDTKVNDFTGKFIDWHLKLWGESKDASKAKLLPMPNEEDDNDHAIIATTTVAAITTTLPPQPSGTNTAEITPSHQPDRPVNSKPSSSSPTDEEQTAEPSASNSGLFACP